MRWFSQLSLAATAAFLSASSSVDAFSRSIDIRSLRARPRAISNLTPSIFSQDILLNRRLNQGNERRHQSLFSRRPSLPLRNAKDDNDDPLFDIRTTLSLVGGQSLLIVAAIVAASLLKTPNYGLGPNVSFSSTALWQGTKCAIPLFLLAYALDSIEDKFPALQDVTKATQRSVLAFLGGTFKPFLAVIVSLVLGLVAGFGEEMLFRGVFQYELGMKFGTFVGVGVPSVIFGLLHAVTPLYAILSTLASVLFGCLYVWSGNLAVPIFTHAVYDVGALLWAHWTVVNMTSEERQALVDWNGPGGSSSSSSS